MILGAIFIVLGVLIYSTISVEKNIFLDFFSSVTYPFQKCFNYVSDAAWEFSDYFEDINKTREENKKLKQEISELRDITSDYYDVKRENARFVKYYDFKKNNSSLKFVSASVIGINPAEFFGDFIIDNGSNSGISLNDIVITENGVVGTICKVGTSSSRVRTIMSPDSKIGVIDSKTSDSGIISGFIKKRSENITKMNFIPAQSSMSQGDILVTSGLSGMYPKNLKLGKIRSIEYDDYESSYYAIVEPFENIEKIKDVFVITDFQGKGEITLSTES